MTLFTFPIRFLNNVSSQKVYPWFQGLSCSRQSRTVPLLITVSAVCLHVMDCNNIRKWTHTWTWPHNCSRHLMQIAVWLRPYSVMPSTSIGEIITAVQVSSPAAHVANPPPDMKCDFANADQLKLKQRLIVLFRLSPPNIQILQRLEISGFWSVMSCNYTNPFCRTYCLYFQNVLREYRPWGSVVVKALRY
jgi:hypothetical protein